MAGVVNDPGEQLEGLSPWEADADVQQGAAELRGLAGQGVKPQHLQLKGSQVEGDGNVEAWCRPLLPA